MQITMHTETVTVTARKFLKTEMCREFYSYRIDTDEGSVEIITCGPLPHLDSIAKAHEEIPI